MSVVRLKRVRPRRSIRYYLITDEGPVRMPPRLSRDMSARLIALPQFAKSVQRMIEVIFQIEGQKISSVSLRPTSTRFDQDGKVDLHDAAEIMAEIVTGSKPTRMSENVLDIRPTLRTRARDRDTNWRISPIIKRKILADIMGQAKLPVFRTSS